MEWTREEFAAAVTEHGRRMFRAARAVLDSDADAEDAVSQAVLQAWQSLDRLKNREAVRPWLVKIAVNCAYAQRRRQGRVVYLDDLAQEPAAPEAVRCDGLWEAVCGGVVLLRGAEGGRNRAAAAGSPGDSEIPAVQGPGAAEGNAARSGG